MNRKISYMFGWALFLSFQAFIAWRVTHHIGAALLTFLWLTIPVALWVRRESRKRAALMKPETKLES